MGADGGGIDRVLRWGLVATLLVAVGVLTYGTIAAYSGRPPIPGRVVGPDGQVLYTGEDIVDGKAVFQRADLMDFGTLYGNGAYFGPDWGDDYLHRETLALRDFYAGRDLGTTYADLSGSQRSRVDGQVRTDLKTNRYRNGTLMLTEGEVAAYEQIRAYYGDLFSNGDKRLGLPADTVRDPSEADLLTSFFGWAAWTSVADRPGASYSYINNWPFEPVAGNLPTRAMYLWSWASLVGMLIFGAGVYVLYQRFIARPAGQLEPPSVPVDVPLTPSQRSTGKWFLMVPALLLLQALAGIILAHYYSDRASFYGLDLRGVLPFNVSKAWHLQFAIAWVAAAWMGAGLFLAPIVGGREPKRQRLLVDALWATVVLAVAGTAVGLWLGARGHMGGGWFWFGNQGLEYIQLGRAFQIALFAGLVIWAAILARAFWPGLRAKKTWGSLEHLLLYSGAAIALVYAFGMQPISGIMESATLTDYWRWWVVHLWVENTFEFFTVAVVGYALLAMGFLSRRMVERTVYFELILVFGAGIVGMGHHFYWMGAPAVWMGLGATFSILEVIPLGVMLARAWHEYRAVRAAGEGFPQRTAFMFFTSAAVWNVVGAGILGGVINPPIANYYEHGTFLTLAHSHGSMMGVFGLLAIGLLYLAVRGMTPAERWSDRLPLWALRLFNVAITLWLVLNIIPIGIAQLRAVMDHGYWYARSLDFYGHWVLFQWLRMPGDAAFGLAGMVVLADLLLKLPFRRRPTIGEGEDLPLPALPGHAPASAS